MYVALCLLALLTNCPDESNARASEPPAKADSRFVMLTQDRIRMLPESERRSWQDYLDRSQQLANREREVLSEECRSSGKSKSVPAPGNSREFEPEEDTSADWYSSDEAKRLTETVLSYQTPSGGWSKSIDYSKGPRPKGTHWTSQSGAGWHYCGTLDNRSTTEQIRFLARVFTQTKQDDAKQGVLKGLEWLFNAQYPNGGWPQNYPVERGYHEAITLNDDAMLHAMELLLDLAEGNAPFEFAEDSLRERARDAFQRGLICLARMQIRINDRPAVWCAQHDPISLAPVSARKKEPVSLSGGESTSLLKFLMRRGPVDTNTQSMIEPAIRWLDEHRITGLKKVKNAEGRTDYVPDAASSEIYWARFYDFHTGKPIFAGAEDGIIYSTYSEMAQHNRVGYDYFTTKPRDLLEKEVPRWKKRLASERQ